MTDLVGNPKDRFSHNEAHIGKSDLGLNCLSFLQHVFSFIYLQETSRTVMSHVMRKSAFCICENKEADQLCGNRVDNQCLCFRYIDSTISLLPKSQDSSLSPSSVAVQLGLCRTWSET